MDEGSTGVGGEGIYLDGDIALVNVHGSWLCEGRPCVIHHPSAHHLREWRLVWRDDKGVVTAERLCRHGVGHPDPDDLAYHLSVGRGWLSVHGCDGCCNLPDDR